MTLPIFNHPSIYDHFSDDYEIILRCADTLKFLKTIPDETIQLIITSPPYNLGKEYESRQSITTYLETQRSVIDKLLTMPNVKANYPEKTMPSCQYPIRLMEWCVLSLTKEADLVLYQYFGVGLALIATLKHNRKSDGHVKERESITFFSIN